MKPAEWGSKLSKKINPNCVKIHRNYSVEETANLLFVHKNTVLKWIKNGLTTVDNNKPILILGFVLKEFLRKKLSTNKRRCKTEEIYCMKCKKPQEPFEKMVDYIYVNKNTGRLNGVCSVCNSSINKFVSNKKLSQVSEKLDVFLTQDQKQLFNPFKSLVNSNLKQREKTL